MKNLWILALGIGLLGITFPASAHHSVAAEYDQSREITLVGKLTMVQLLNPHGWLNIDAKNPEGKIENWSIELPGPSALRRNGADPSIYDTLRTSGEVVTVTAYPAKDGSKHALGGSLTRADGQTVIPLGGRFLQRGGYGRRQGQPPQGQAPQS